MARPITSLNLSSIYHQWHESETDRSFVYSLSPEQVQNGSIDPYILAATTLLHLLVSVSRRLLNTDISDFEYLVLSPTYTLENLARLAAKPGVRSTLVLSVSDGSIIKSTGLLASSTSPRSPESPITGDGLKKGSNSNNDEGEEDHSRSAEHVARMVFQYVAAASDFAEGMEKGDNPKLLRMRTRKQEIVIVPGV
ncbi:MAG: hypothetical protein Q9182_000058 [Xanthomendoza sp. 2 TL-2023]